MKPLWQTDEWENFQKALGHRVLRVDDQLMIIHRLFFGLNYGYVPRGPVDDREDFLMDLKKVAKRHRLIFTRVDPERAFRLTTLNSRLSTSIQPETTLILDLTKSETEILAQMKRKGRYNIGLAEKKGVIVHRAEGDEERAEFCHEFYEILRETTQRDVFSAHDEGYYQTMLKAVPSSEIFMARYQDRFVSGAICTFQGDRAIYYYGASGNLHRDVMAPYLVQWKAILEAKRRGCKTYDFLGIAPEDALEDHPWKGITDFKRKFGGVVIRYPKPIDIVHRPFWYTVYKALKAVQNFFKGK